MWTVVSMQQRNEGRLCSATLWHDVILEVNINISEENATSDFRIDVGTRLKEQNCFCNMTCTGGCGNSF